MTRHLSSTIVDPPAAAILYVNAYAGAADCLQEWVRPLSRLAIPLMQPRATIGSSSPSLLFLVSALFFSGSELPLWSLSLPARAPLHTPTMSLSKPPSSAEDDKKEDSPRVYVDAASIHEEKKDVALRCALLFELQPCMTTQLISFCSAASPDSSTSAAHRKFVSGLSSPENRHY